ncbi:MAG TPA: SPOR domain-containing protein [Gemmatimonadales bacterium]|nr:SPOR domain-containing protein [Gemmatimonadales bacterium]
MGHCRGGLLAGVFAAAAFTAVAQGQTDPRLAAAVRSAQEGQSDSARNVVRRLLAATPPTDTLYPEILYTQAMVAGEAGEMRRHLQRVAVEYGGSSWADDALLRLIQMDYATRNFEGAARNLERLRLDYPLTPLLPQAAYWAGRTYFDLGNTDLGCRWLADGIARAQDIETRNQLEYLNQRCGAPAQGPAAPDTGARVRDPVRAPAPPADTARPADSGPRPAAAPQPRAAPEGDARFRVQVAAVATPGAADEAASRVEALGFPALIVRERGLYKVRAGAFGTREEAQAAVGKLKASLGGSPFIVAEP